MQGFKGGSNVRFIVLAIALSWVLMTMLLYSRLDLNPQVSDLQRGAQKTSLVVDSLDKKALQQNAKVEEIQLELSDSIRRLRLAEDAIAIQEEKMKDLAANDDQLAKLLEGMMKDRGNPGDPGSLRPNRDGSSSVQGKLGGNRTLVHTPRDSVWTPSFSEEKKAAMDAASEWLTKEIYRVQNPTNCETARHHVCPITNACGGGCALHQLAYCFVVGFASGRVTHFPDGWKYLKDCEGGSSWSCMFEPMTRCSMPKGQGEAWSETADKNGVSVTHLGYFTRSNTKKNFVPWAASDGFHTNTLFWQHPHVADAVRQHHGDARVWLVGHLETYMLRLNDKSLRLLHSINRNVTGQWGHPIAGVHVRRTDHKIEAPFRNLKEYMEKVDAWYAKQPPSTVKRVYLATDENAVLLEALRDYPQYQWLYHQHGDVIAGFVKPGTAITKDARTSWDGTLALFSDWSFLSSVDYLVGTSSSQVTRMGYELMNAKRVDASISFGSCDSLDDPWYFP